MARETRMTMMKNTARFAANPLDYRKVIVPRSFAKSWRPRDPRVLTPLQLTSYRYRNQVAFANR